MMDSLFLMKDAAIVFTALAAGLCTAVVLVAVQWRKVRQAELETCLKQEMIHRGMSADEIIRVLQATTLYRPEEKQTNSEQ